MRIFAFDTETYPIVKYGKATTNPTPRCVCVQYAWGNDGTPHIELRREGAETLWRVIQDEDVRFVGANVAYDMRQAVRLIAEELDIDAVPAVFEAYDAGRVWDIQLAEQLNDIAHGGLFSQGGGYSLSDLAKRRLDVGIEGKHGADSWRLRYNELDGVPPEHWPERARAYAELDAVYTLRVYQAQQAAGLDNAHQTPFQACCDWSLSLMGAWGARIDPDRAEDLADHYEAIRDHWKRVLEDAGLIIDGTLKRAKKEALFTECWASIGQDPLLTDNDSVSTGKEARNALIDAGVKHPLFEALVHYGRSSKFLSTYIEPILDAQEGPLCPRFNCLVDSGRTSSSGPNVQNIPARPTAEERLLMAYQKDKSVGLQYLAKHPDTLYAERIRVGEWPLKNLVLGSDIRKCWVPRPGTRFIAADYSALEMCGLAQVNRNLNGELTPLGESINRGEDQHLRVAAVLMGISYDEAKRRYEAGDPQAAQMRTVSKIANFGFAGGASPSTLVVYARGFGTTITEEMAVKAYNAWHGAWTEMAGYFAWIKAQETPEGYRIDQHGPGRQLRGWRERLTYKYTSAANTMFQGICADGAKFACWRVSKECYTDVDSPLYGSRPILFIHDEIIIEAPEDRVDEAAQRLSDVMVDAMNAFIPDIKLEAEADILEGAWVK